MAADLTKGYVYRATTSLPPETMADLLTTHFEGATGIVRRPDWTEMIRLTPGDGASILEQWREGRLFNRAAELRWKKTTNGFAALWLSEQVGELDGFSLIEGSPFTAAFPTQNTSHGFLLWGTPRHDNDKEYWMEARIPRVLRYPGFTANTRRHPPRLSYRLYRNHETVRWVRLVELTEVDDE